MLWLNTDANNEPVTNEDVVGPVIMLIAGGVYLFYRIVDANERLERHVRWLEMMLKAVNSHHAEDMSKTTTSSSNQTDTDIDAYWQSRVNSLRENP